MRDCLFSIFKKYPKVSAAISQKTDGPMSSRKLFFQGKRDKKIIKNRGNFFKKNGINPDFTFSAQQIHGNKVKIVSKKGAAKILAGTDGIITKEKNLFLSITVADCLPVFVYEFKKEIVGLIHCGWRGLAKDILGEAIKILTKDFGCHPQNIIAGIGPGVSKCHFEVKKDLLERFKKIPKKFLKKKRGNIFLDLKGLAENRLLGLGLKKQNIEISKDCTYCLDKKYFSYRRDNPENPETMVAIIGMREYNGITKFKN